MGRGSDTRLYNSRSESSTMFRYNDGYESRYNPGDPKYLDAEKEKKQKEQDKQEEKLKNRKHVKVTPAMLQQFKDDPSETRDDTEEDPRSLSGRLTNEGEINALTGPPGNGGLVKHLPILLHSSSKSGSSDFRVSLTGQTVTGSSSSDRVFKASTMSLRNDEYSRLPYESRLT